MNFIKEKTGIFIRLTSNMEFYAAVLILSIEKHCNLVSDYIIVTDDINKNFNLIREICNKFNKGLIIHNFIQDKLPLDKIKKSNDPFYKRYPLIVFSLFDIFDYLRQYDNLIALDVDMFCKEDFSEILTYKPIAYRRSRKLKEILTNFPDSNIFTPNAGFIYLNKSVLISIPHDLSLSNYCYKIFNQNFYNLQNGGYEEAIFRKTLFDFNIKCNEVPITYNCYPMIKETYNAKFIHFMKIEKPWRSSIVGASYPEYLSLSKNLLTLSNNSDDKYFTYNIDEYLYDTNFQKNFCFEFNKQLYNYLIEDIHNYCHVDFNFNYTFISLYLNKLDKRHHIDLRWKNENWLISKDYLSSCKRCNIKNISIIFSIDVVDTAECSPNILRILEKRNYISFNYKYLRYKKDIKFDNLLQEIKDLLTEFELSN